MRRWRQDKVGPTWHKLFHHVRYHEVDVFEFEQQSAQHWLTIPGDRERAPRHLPPVTCPNVKNSSARIASPVAHRMRFCAGHLKGQPNQTMSTAPFLPTHQATHCGIAWET
jgi:hypothetical protein